MTAGLGTQAPPESDLDVIIVWPQPDDGLRGWKIAVLDARTGAMITSVCALAVHASAEGTIWAEAQMFATPEGRPVLDGRVHADPESTTLVPGCLKGTFRLRVSEMRVASQPGSAWPDEAAESQP